MPCSSRAFDVLASTAHVPIRIPHNLIPASPHHIFSYPFPPSPYTSRIPSLAHLTAPIQPHIIDIYIYLHIHLLTSTLKKSPRLFFHLATPSPPSPPPPSYSALTLHPHSPLIFRIPLSHHSHPVLNLNLQKMPRLRPSSRPPPHSSYTHQPCFSFLCAIFPTPLPHFSESMIKRLFSSLHSASASSTQPQL